VTKLNGSQPSDPLDELDDVIAELEGSEWDDEEITETNITVEKGATVVVTTGKHAAMSKDQAEEITVTDHGVPQKQSDPPPSKVSLLAIGWVAAKRAPPWGIIILGVVGIIAYVVLKR
jgi:hypothetical protein